MLTVLQEVVSSSTVIFVLLGATAASGTLPQQNSTIKPQYDGQLAVGRGIIHHQRYGGHRRYLCTNGAMRPGNMTSSSTLTDLTLNSGATINFSHEDGETMANAHHQ
ncbi:autotransporter MisL [Salmonella enterica subsp. enterica]|nr:autotransporter MisL [Salmonella enterica subsp. enterica]